MVIRAPTAVPHERGVAGPAPVKYEGLLDLARRRRSVRWFLQKPVPREMIDRAVAVAALSPSACNLQPFEFRVFDDAELTQKVASIPTGTPRAPSARRSSSKTKGAFISAA